MSQHGVSFVSGKKKPKEAGQNIRTRQIPRYRPGVKPEWVDSDEEEDLLNAAKAMSHSGGIARASKRTKPTSKKMEISRTERRRGVVGSDSDGEDDSDPEVRRRRKVSAQIVGIDTSKLEAPAVEQEEEEDSSEDEEALARRRARIRAQALRRRQEEEEEEEGEGQGRRTRKTGAGGDGDDDDEEGEGEGDSDSGSSEYTTDDSDEEVGFIKPMLKPVFVSRKDRKTIEERERLEELEEKQREEEKLRLEERKLDSKRLVVEQLAIEENQQDAEEGDALPDDNDDDLDEEEAEKELEMWKLRELLRLKRDRNARRLIEEEDKETERRRKMTDAEIMALRKKEMEGKDENEKGSYKFMQRYYHKGAFFSGDHDDLMSRDYSIATGYDAEVDKSALPQVMQVKKFGMRGQTKYTHLKDQDTSNLEANPWVQAEALRKKRKGRDRGYDDRDDRQRSRSRDRDTKKSKY